MFHDTITQLHTDWFLTACFHREEFLAKIQKRVDTYKIEELNPPRENKKLLVLDIDYTLFGKTLRRIETKDGV